MDVHNRMRVVFYEPSGHGGICHYTYQLGESLARSGTEVTLLTTQGYELAHLDRQFKVKLIFKRSATKAWLESLLVRISGRLHAPMLDQGKDQTNGVMALKFCAPSLVKKLRLRLLLYKTALALSIERPSIIHVQWLMDGHEDYKFIKLLKRLGLTVVYTAHDLLPNTAESAIDCQLYKMIFKQVDAVIVHSRGSKDEIIRIFGIDHRKVHVIPHGSNDLPYRKRELSKEEAKKSLGISPEKKVILFFGIIKRYKGLEYLAEAFLRVKQQLRTAVLLVVGSIYDRDAEGFAYYSRLVKEISQWDDVICVPTYVPLEQIADYFFAADVVVLPYAKTYTSGVLLSAYAAGRAVVGTDTGALTEVIEPGKSGMIVPPKEIHSLANAILEVLQDPNIEQMGSYAKYLGTTRYSWNNIASKTSDLYDSLRSGSAASVATHSR